MSGTAAVPPGGPHQPGRSERVVRAEAFTSINVNYLAKARVLGWSLRKHHPEIRLHLMLCDEIPDGFDLEREPFASVLRIPDLGIEEWRSWAFGHGVVELCTAAKPFAFRELMQRHRAERFFYFDPDLVFFSRCDALFDRLQDASILLTPHVTRPDEDPEAVMDNEISSMAHGIYNLGFLGLRDDARGRGLVDWWCRRLRHFCHDDIPRGLFTDQRWMDFAPAFFDGCEVVRDPEFNVATWNYSTRRLSGSLRDGFLVDGRPLGFHHYTGFDSGANRRMLEKYAGDVPAAWELVEWYREECERHGQAELAARPWAYATYANGDPIETKERILYRNRSDLQETFPDPYAVTGDGRSYHDWVRAPENEEALVLLGRGRPPFAEFVRESFRLLRVYVRETPRLGPRRKRFVLAALGAGSRLCRAAARAVGLK